MAIATTGMSDGQVVQTAQASTTQASFRQMVGEVAQWNPDAPIPMVEKWVNNSYRRIIDARNWYGLLVHGQISVPAIYSTGTVSVTNGSATVTGSGTSFTSAMIGRQFRIGFTKAIRTIKAVPGATELTLDLAWGEADQSGAGYQIFQQLVSFGANVKRVEAVLNLVHGWRLSTDIPRLAIDARDPWRSHVGFPYVCASHGPNASGVPLWELYPIPTAQQAFPFIVYIQPPDLSDDNTFPYAFIRSDVIVSAAIKDALLFRGRTSRYYDPQTAMVKEQEFQRELQKMAMADDSHWMKDLIWQYRQYPTAGGSSEWAQMHDVDYE